MKYIEKLKNDDNVLSIILFGSKTREQIFHDIDVILIVKEKKTYEFPINYDVWIYTLDEFKEFVYKGYPFLLNILVEGKPIKGKDVWEKLKRLYYILNKDKNIEVEYKGRKYSIRDLLRSIRNN